MTPFASEPEPAPSTMTVDRDTCGDPALGAGCDGGLWWISCGRMGCDGMCIYDGPCECTGCGSELCCYVWSGLRSEEPDPLFDTRIRRYTRRPIVEGPPVP